MKIKNDIYLLIKESYNFKDKRDFNIKYQDKISRIIIIAFLLLIISILVSIFHTSPKYYVIEILNFSTNFYSIIIGFCITSVVFLAGDFNRFQDKTLDGLDDDEKINTCKQISSTLLLTIYLSIFILIISVLNNYIFINTDFVFNYIPDIILIFINTIYIFFIFMNLFLSIILILKTLKYLKKYIDMVIERNGWFLMI